MLSLLQIHPELNVFIHVLSIYFDLKVFECFCKLLLIQLVVSAFLPKVGVDTFPLLQENCTSQVHGNIVEAAWLAHVLFLELASLGHDCVCVFDHNLLNYIFDFGIKRHS